MKEPSDWHKTKYFFLGNPVPSKRDWRMTRLLAQKKLSSDALLKLEWIIFYHTIGKKNATATAQQFGITRKMARSFYQ